MRATATTYLQAEEYARFTEAVAQSLVGQRTPVGVDGLHVGVGTVARAELSDDRKTITLTLDMDVELPLP